MSACARAAGRSFFTAGLEKEKGAMPVPAGETLEDESGLYDRDFFAWTLVQAAHLRDGRLAALDRPHLLEELEAMGAGEKTAVKRNMRVVLLHLLKMQAQPEKRTRSWDPSIAEHRLRLADDLAASPSLRGYAREALPDAYRGAVTLACKETGLPRDAFPADCPYGFEQVLSQDFPPES
jgi:hypothetical protein